MEIFKAIFKTEDTEGVYGISLVNDPAMDSHFVALSKEDEPETIQLKSIDNERRIVMGAVLIPDKKILRLDKQTNTPYCIVFPKETIEQTQLNFFKRGNQNNSTAEHVEKRQYDQLKLSGVTFFESWIKEDAVHDKSVMYGFDEPVGTLYMSAKIENDEVWGQVKAGKFKGFSIDGVFNMEQINLNKNEIEMDVKKMVMECLESVGLKKAEPIEVKLGSVVTVGENPVTINFEGDTITPGATQVTMTGADGQEVPVPDGEYPTEDGKVLMITGSVVAEVKEGAAAPEDGDNAVANMEAAPAPQVKSEKHTQEVFYQLSKEDLTAMVLEISKGVEAQLTKFKAEFKAELPTAEAVSLTKTKGEPARTEPKTAFERFREHNKKFN